MVPRIGPAAGIDAAGGETPSVSFPQVYQDIRVGTPYAHDMAHIRCPFLLAGQRYYRLVPVFHGGGSGWGMHEARAVVNVRDSREMARWRITSA